MYWSLQSADSFHETPYKQETHYSHYIDAQSLFLHNIAFKNVVTGLRLYGGHRVFVVTIEILTY